MWSVSTGHHDRKREASSSSLHVPSAKKLKGNIAGKPPTLPSSSFLSSAAQPAAEPWEALAAECEPQELFDRIVNYGQAGNTDRAVSVFVIVFFWCDFFLV